MTSTECVISKSKAGVGCDRVDLVFQTLTGKEIEIDIEPTDKVK